jgi:hypothetical protein
MQSCPYRVRRRCHSSWPLNHELEKRVVIALAVAAERASSGGVFSVAHNTKTDRESDLSDQSRRLSVNLNRYRCACE